MHWVQLTEKKGTGILAPYCRPFPLPCTCFLARVQAVGLSMVWKSRRSGDNIGLSLTLHVHHFIGLQGDR